MKKLVYLAAVAVLCSCTALSLPDNWKEIDADAYENASFKEAAGSIDPEQTWNLAQDAYLVSGAEFTQVQGPVSTKSDAAIGLKVTNETEKRAKAVAADYYRASSNFYVNLVDVDGEATYTLGIYYKTIDHVHHEQVLWSNFTKGAHFEAWYSFFYDNASSFGFFLESTKNGETHKYYSQRSKNGDYTQITNKIYDDDYFHLHLGPYYIFMEDGFGEYDFEDITISITCANVQPFEVKPLDYDCGPWMVICEDVGSEADNDFNDVVFSVSRPDATHIQLELLAAGATRLNVIYFGDQRIGEVHELFNVPDVTRMINTYQGTDGEIGKTVYELPPYKSDLITVDRSFTMASDNMGGFRVTSNNEASVIYTSPDQKGHAPFMICTPATDFCWALEQISIFDAYPQFRTWVGDKTKATNWFDYPAEGKVYVRTVSE